ncbi:hypothetical protein VCO01S_11680 [Vibrio comitans NBRC 102076]|uniref:Uncharacterized protein n=1 Tax=Vibrio comitans NBRC 102076 TaxID=1219078 RepID=A0A4Y3ILH3_9VIBR|nr:hypothetical protein VCO01S_11680 [Vibrio comitans NBRC 102076]
MNFQGWKPSYATAAVNANLPVMSTRSVWWQAKSRNKKNAPKQEHFFILNWVLQKVECCV